MLQKYFIGRKLFTIVIHYVYTFYQKLVVENWSDVHNDVTILTSSNNEDEGDA